MWCYVPHGQLQLVSVYGFSLFSGLAGLRFTLQGWNITKHWHQYKVCLHLVYTVFFSSYVSWLTEQYVVRPNFESLTLQRLATSSLSRWPVRHYSREQFVGAWQMLPYFLRRLIIQHILWVVHLFGLFSFFLCANLHVNIVNIWPLLKLKGLGC